MPATKKPASKKKSKSNTNNLIGIIVGLLIILIIPAYLIFNNQSSVDLPQYYENEEWKLAFNYPEGWEIKEYNDSSTTASLTVFVSSPDQDGVEVGIGSMSSNNNPAGITEEDVKGFPEVQEADHPEFKAYYIASEFGEGIPNEYSYVMFSDTNLYTTWYTDTVENEVDSNLEIFNAITKSVKTP